MSRPFWQEVLQENSGSTGYNVKDGDAEQWMDIALKDCSDHRPSHTDNYRHHHYENNRLLANDPYSAAAFGGLNATCNVYATENHVQNDQRVARSLNQHSSSRESEETVSSLSARSNSGHVPIAVATDNQTAFITSPIDERDVPEVSCSMPMQQKVDIISFAHPSYQLSIEEVRSDFENTDGVLPAQMADSSRIHTAAAFPQNHYLESKFTSKESELGSMTLHHEMRPEVLQPSIAVAQVIPITSNSFQHDTSVKNDVACAEVVQNVARVDPIVPESSAPSAFVAYSINSMSANSTTTNEAVQNALTFLVTSSPKIFSEHERICDQAFSQPERVTQGGRAVPHMRHEQGTSHENQVIQRVRSVSHLIDMQTDKADCSLSHATVAMRQTNSTSAESIAESAPLTGLKSEHMSCVSSIVTQDFEDLNNLNLGQEQRSQYASIPVVNGSTVQSDSKSALADNQDHSITAATNDCVKKRGVRHRYRYIKKQYPEIVKRLDDRIRAEASATEFSLNASLCSEIDLNRKTRAAEDVSVPDFNQSSIGYSQNLSMHRSFTVADSMDSTQNSLFGNPLYGEEFIQSQRRSRFSKFRTSSMVNRMTRSDMGDVGPYKGPAAQVYRRRLQCEPEYPNSNHHGYSASGRQSQATSVDRRTPFEYTNAHMQQRPLSSFDSAGYAGFMQSGGRYGAFDVYRNLHSDDRVGEIQGKSLRNNDKSSGSVGTDDEVAQLCENRQSLHYSQMRYGCEFGEDEYYYFGAIHMSRDRVANIIRKHPLPQEYYRLPPIEKAAYIFYCALYRHHFQPVNLFHNKFNRELYGYVCEGDSEEMALWKICKHTLDEFYARRSLGQFKAYDTTQQQLLSDYYDTSDSRASDHGSHFDEEDYSDNLSLDSTVQEPHKFRAPHSFMNFCAAGKVVHLDSASSNLVIEIRDMKSLISHPETLATVHSFESFKGPLILGVTPTHSVLLYIQGRIEKILQFEPTSDCISSDADAHDCLLIWLLLEMLVQQQGRVSGPDISRLLLCGYQKIQTKSNDDNGACSDHFVPLHDTTSYERFNHLLMGGHLNEALDCALKCSLFSEAMVLARRIFAHDEQKITAVETAFISQKSDYSPFVTLMNVASGFPAPILTSSKARSTAVWRAHVAIILANLSTPFAFQTIHQFALSLAQDRRDFAADFCFLAIHLLSNYDCFQTPAEGDDVVRIRKHVTLIHASLNDSTAEFGEKNFSLVDFHATEIFEFALKLSHSGVQAMALSRSLVYQLYKLDYAEMLMELGGYALDAFRYSGEIVRAIWDRITEIDIQQLLRLCDLADRLHYIANANESDVSWIPTLRNLIHQRKLSNVSNRSDNTNTNAALNEAVSTKCAVGTVSGANISRRRTDSVTSKAADWHADLQDPIGMKASNDIGGTAVGTAYSDSDQIMQISIPNIVDSNQLRHASVPVINDHSDDNAQSATHTIHPNPSKKYTATDEIQPDIDEISAEQEQLYMCNKIDIDAKGESFNQTTNTNDSIANVGLPVNGASFHSRGTVLPVRSETAVKNKNFPMKRGSYISAPHVSRDMQMGTMALNGPERAKSELSNNQHRGEQHQSTTRVTHQHQSSSHTAGIFSKLKAKIIKAIPSSNEMILPDDSNPTIVWDPVKQKYIGDGVEEATAHPPPSEIIPLSNINSGHVSNSVGSLTAARLSGGSRYFNPLIKVAELSQCEQMHPIVAPPVSAPTIFGFIPSAPDDDDSAETPFSVNEVATVVSAGT